MSQLPNDVNASASGGSTLGATDQNSKDLLQQIVRELGAIRAVLGCSTPTTGANAFVVGAGAGPLVGSKTWDPGSIADGDDATTTVTVTGAAIGDFVDASLGVDLGGLFLGGYVSATNTVTAILLNNTGGAVDLASSTLKVRVIPQQAAAASSVPAAMKLTL